MNVADALRDTRKALGVSLTGLASAVSVDTQALLRYESGERDIPGELLWRFSDILGVPFEEVTSAEDLQRHIEALAVRFKAHQQTVPERVRLAVAQAAVAARHYVELEALAERPSRYEQLTALFPDDLPIPARQIWRTGRDLAVQARQRFSIPLPVPSILNLVTGPLKILVIWQRLPIEVAGYALCEEIHGPLIVVNVNGRNKNELVRRFTLAHETAHVLFDRQHMEELGSFDVYEDLFGYADDSKDPREVRANAFAIHLLSPEFALNNAWNPNEEPRKAVRSFMTSFGISYEAARHHLANYGLLPIQEKLSAVATSAPDPMKVAESPELWYPIFDKIPIERRHAVAPLAFELWTDHRITTSRLREVLGVELSFEELSELAGYYLDAPVT